MLVRQYQNLMPNYDDQEPKKDLLWSINRCEYYPILELLEEMHSFLPAKSCITLEYKVKVGKANKFLFEFDRLKSLTLSQN